MPGREAVGVAADGRRAGIEAPPAVFALPRLLPRLASSGPVGDGRQVGSPPSSPASWRIAGSPSAAGSLNWMM